MTISEKPPLGLTPRHFWLRKRTMECIRALKDLEDIDDWETYRSAALEFSKELNYAVTEWGKYYDNQ